MKRNIVKKIICAALAALMLVGSLTLVSCTPRTSVQTDDTLKVGTLDLPKNLNPYSSTASSSTFFVGFLYDTLLSSIEEPTEYSKNGSYKFPDGTDYVPVNADENPLLLESNLIDVCSLLPKKEGSEYGYEYFDPTDEQWAKQCEKESIFFGKDELGQPIEETEEEFLARAVQTVPKENWMRFRFKINKDFTWNDGEPFTAKDIKFTFDYIVKHAGSLGSFAYFLTDYHESTVDGDDLIFIFSSSKYSDLKAVTTAIVIIPQHIWGTVRNPSSEKNLNPVGTGPYYLAEGDYIEGNSVTVTLRENYSPALIEREFRYDPLKRVQVILMSNEDVLINALQEGSIDMMIDSVNSSKAYAVANNNYYDKVKQSSVRSDFVTTLLFNVGEYGIFNEKNLNGYSLDIRKAISLCIDQDKLIDDVLHGMGCKVGDCLVQDYYNHAYTDENGKYIYHETNVEKANAILDATSYKMDGNGSRGLTFKAYANPGNEILVRAIATQLRAIGITLEYEQATSTYSEKIKQSNHADFDIIINSVTFTADKLLMFSARYGVYENGSCRVFNHSGLNDEELSALMRRMEICPSTGEQYRLCKEVQKYVAGLYVEIPLYSANNITLYSDQRLEGWIEVNGASIFNGCSTKYMHFRDQNSR